MPREKFTPADLTQFAKDVFAAGQQPKALIQLVPMRNGDIARGCKVRFRLNTSL